jgi:molybdenum cofactor cytidylyltransferase
MGVGAVVLAAGRSSRMAPANKLLMPLGDRPVIRQVVQTALKAGLDPVTVVSGHDREEVLAALAGLPVRIVSNDDYAEGLASSLRAGVAAIAVEVEAALCLLGDMPLVSLVICVHCSPPLPPRRTIAFVFPRMGPGAGIPYCGARSISLAC